MLTEQDLGHSRGIGQAIFEEAVNGSSEYSHGEMARDNSLRWVRQLRPSVG